MWNWREQILALCTALFFTAGLTLRKEIPNLGFSFIGLGSACLMILIVLWLKGRKKYGVAGLASDMETMSPNLADFIEERGRADPTNRIKMPKPNWDDDRKHEEWEEQRRELIEYGRETMRIYGRRFAARVAYLVREARKLGYEDEELDRLYQHRTNRLSIGMLSDKMGALSLRMRKDMK
jgi:hypothetical protein